MKVLHRNVLEWFYLHICTYACNVTSKIRNLIIFLFELLLPFNIYPINDDFNQLYVERKIIIRQ